MHQILCPSDKSETIFKFKCNMDNVCFHFKELAKLFIPNIIYFKRMLYFTFKKNKLNLVCCIRFFSVFLCTRYNALVKEVKPIFCQDLKLCPGINELFDPYGVTSGMHVRDISNINNLYFSKINKVGYLNSSFTVKYLIYLLFIRNQNKY